MRRRIQIIESMDLPVMRATQPPIDIDRVWEAPWPTDMVEKSGNVGVYYQAAMKNEMTLALCRALSVTSELHYNRMAGYFNGKPPEQMKLVVASLSKSHDGTGGGYHLTSAGTTCFADVKLDKTHKRFDPAFTSFIFVAEAIQPFAWFSARGWADDSDQGEALSRVMAITIMPGQLGPYGVSVKWLNNGRPDWTRQRTGQYLGRSIGCGMAFLFWARYKRNIPWDVIIRAGKGMDTATIEDIWTKRLGGAPNVYDQMIVDVNKAYPPGVPVPDDEQHEVLFKSH